MTPDAEDIASLLLTLRLAALTTVLLLLVCTPLAWWLARSRSPLRAPVGALVALPLVLPPTVLGFYLLLLLGPHGPIGQMTQSLGFGLLTFSFSGLVAGSLVYSLPFAVWPLRNAFEAVGARPLEAAATLGAGPIDRFFSIALPLALPGYFTAALLCFVHTVGEFGIVLMLGGNLPGKTRTVSVALFNHVEALEYRQAHALALGLVVFAFLALLLLDGGRSLRRLQRPKPSQEAA